MPGCWGGTAADGGVYEGGGATAGAVGALEAGKGWPQALQNPKPSGTLAPHLEQNGMQSPEVQSANRLGTTADRARFRASYRRRNGKAIAKVWRNSKTELAI